MIFTPSAGSRHGAVTHWIVFAIEPSRGRSPRPARSLPRHLTPRPARSLPTQWRPTLGRSTTVPRPRNYRRDVRRVFGQGHAFVKRGEARTPEGRQCRPSAFVLVLRLARAGRPARSSGSEARRRRRRRRSRGTSFLPSRPENPRVMVPVAPIVAERGGRDGHVPGAADPSSHVWSLNGVEPTTPQPWTTTV